MMDFRERKIIILVTAAVVVIQAASVCGIIRHDEVPVDLVESRNRRGASRPDCRPVRQPIPGVEGAVLRHEMIER